MQNPIFYSHSLALLGIITAIVSAIRVAGAPQLHSLIGRAKESRGEVEADLMSSTSPDVCDLWNGEGVVRVKLAAMEKALSLPVSSEGIFTFDDAVRLWLYHTQSSDEQLDGPPDLVLNISIMPLPGRFMTVSLLAGVALQGGVVVFAAISSYVLKLEIDSVRPAASSVPLFAAGTVVLAVERYGDRAAETLARDEGHLEVAEALYRASVDVAEKLPSDNKIFARVAAERAEEFALHDKMSERAEDAES